MKLALVCFCVLQVTAAGAALVARGDLKVIRGKSAKSVRDEPLHVPESVIHGRQRTLFARRGVYERQRVQLSNVASAPSYGRPKVEANSVGPKCSMVSESCVPHSHCCDPRATCHCRFFSAICFCRKMNGRSGKN